MIGLVESLYLDKLLGLEIMDYDVPSDFYGVELNDESRDWLLFLAALAGPRLRDEIISSMADWVGSKIGVAGEERASKGGPLAGGAFAILALAKKEGKGHQKRLLTEWEWKDRKAHPEKYNSTSSHDLGAVGATSALFYMLWAWLPMLPMV
jgi:hypothetical protein